MPSSSADSDPTVGTLQGGPARRWAFAALTIVLVLTAVGYVAWARARQSVPTDDGTEVVPGASSVLFQNLTATGSGRLALASATDPDNTRRLSNLQCARAHYANDHGICLTYEASFPATPQLQIFGPDFQVTRTITLDGLPSRARVSPDGRYGAATTFVTGHSYSDNGFSTSTTLIDMERGTKVANLEEFSVVRDGRPYTAQDVNFWGVTFEEDSNRFFATLSTRGRTYLVEGDIAARRVVVGRENVECPSLSPDGTRIGYKKRVEDQGMTPRWRFHVLDLTTGEDTPLAETRSIDDQLEWLDDDTVLYGDPASSNAVMALPADGTGSPRRFISQASSPIVLRSSASDPESTGLDPAPEVRPADLEVTVDAPTTGAPGETVVHVIELRNVGPGAATHVVIDDRLTGPARVTSAEGHPSPGITDYGCSVLADEGRARCDVSELPAGSTWTASIGVTITGRGSVGGEVVVTAAEPDPEPDNDRRTTQTRSD